MRESLGLTVASTVGTTGLILRGRQVEQLTRMRDVLDTPAVGEQRRAVARPSAADTLPQAGENLRKPSDPPAIVCLIESANHLYLDRGHLFMELPRRK